MWNGANAVGRETLRTCGKILTDIAGRKSTDEVRAGDILSKHMNQYAKYLISKLICRCRKSCREPVGGKKKRVPSVIRSSVPENNKKGHFSYFHFSQTSAADHVCRRGNSFR